MRHRPFWHRGKRVGEPLRARDGRDQLLVRIEDEVVEVAARVARRDARVADELSAVRVSCQHSQRSTRRTPSRSTGRHPVPSHRAHAIGETE